MIPQQTLPRNSWLEGGLCNCCSDSTTCCVTCLLPCVTYADNGQLLHGKDGLRFWTDFFIYFVICWFTGCHCVLGMPRRRDIRDKYDLPQKPCNDCCVHFWCHECALCQENRELKARVAVALPGLYPLPPDVGYSPGVPVVHPPVYVDDPSMQYATAPPKTV